jgi:site-specific DNA-methyltransferase (adenine-specific)
MKPHFENPKAKIYKADCLDFLRSLPDQSIDLIVTDPAYSGMNNKLNFGNGRIVGRYQNQDNQKWFEEFKDDPENFVEFLKQCYRVLCEDRHIYIMFDSFSLLTLAPLMREVFEVKNIIVWDKINIGMGHYFRRRHELIVFASKGKKKLNTRAMPDIWAHKRILNAAYPTQKPVEVFENMVIASANEGYVVCDPFLGSGSAAIAALKHGCTFVGSDIATKACSLSAKRIKEFHEIGIDNRPKATKKHEVTETARLF